MNLKFNTVLHILGEKGFKAEIGQGSAKEDTPHPSHVPSLAEIDDPVVASAGVHHTKRNNVRANLEDVISEDPNENEEDKSFASGC